MRPRHHRHPRQDERSFSIKVASRAISGQTQTGRLLPTIPLAATKLWAIEKKRLNQEKSKASQDAHGQSKPYPQQSGTVATTISEQRQSPSDNYKGKDARCSSIAYASRYKRKRRSHCIRSQRQAEPTCDAWLGNSAENQSWAYIKRKWLPKRKRLPVKHSACQATFSPQSCTINHR